MAGIKRLFKDRQGRSLLPVTGSKQVYRNGTRRTVEESLQSLENQPGGNLRLLFEAAGAVWNDKKRLWLLNELELNDKEIAEIYRYTSNFGSFALSKAAFAYTNIRTNFIKDLSYLWHSGVIELDDDCFAFSKIEVLNLAFNGNSTGSVKLIGTKIFSGCKKLHTIKGILSDERIIDNSGVYSTFFQCEVLRSIKLNRLKISTSFKDSPLLEYDTVKYLIDNAKNTSAITITVHATTYGYLTGTIHPTPEVGGTTEGWQALVTTAQGKQISFATTE